MITARNVSKKFGQSIALSEVSFHIDSGEFVFLTGQSGSGKSTLLKLILCELRADTGELLVAGENVAKIHSGKLARYRRTIGPVFQDFRILADRSIYENIALPLQIRSVKQGEIRSAVHLAAEMVGLTEKLLHFPSQLSGGEIQRVSIARAIVGKPQVILADEPTGNLDPHTAKKTLQLLEDIHQELKSTVIMATHNADLVNHGHKRVIKLELGKITKDESKGKYE